ncbi:MAG TPA: hypothetical protein VFT82_04675 [Candidatus Paceibacterota bacterium]|nr:hypothetical protein [Candidatus Paceibacterota bacterium]
MLNLFTTAHSVDSMRSRLKTPKKRVDVAAFEAMDKGLPREETTGSLRRFIDWKYLPKERSRKLYIWRNQLWIFNAECALITCFPIPGRYANDIVAQTRKWEAKKSKTAVN